MTTLYIVGTPIGNLEDVSLRALRILGEVDTVLCEDTRVTKKLLDRHGILKPVVSYHAHSGSAKVGKITEMLRAGRNLALVSDAGTPAVSDPGAELVRLVRDEFAADIALGLIRIESVPGPSALTAALSVAGAPSSEFTFLGFMPHKKGRQTLFKEISSAERTYIFYESPHRILKTIDSLRKFCADKKITICRELTKIFEEVVEGSAEEVGKYFKTHPDKVRGEFVVIVSPRI